MKPKDNPLGLRIADIDFRNAILRYAPIGKEVRQNIGNPLGTDYHTIVASALFECIGEAKAR